VRKQTLQSLEKYVPCTIPEAIRTVSQHNASLVELIAETPGMSPNLVKRVRKIAKDIRNDGEKIACKVESLLKASKV